MRWILTLITLFGFFVTKETNPQKVILSVDEKVLIHLPEDFDTENLEINFRITGSFGGYASFVRVEPNVRNYQIPTVSEDGKSAETLKLIVFSPKYWLMVFDVPILKNQKRKIEVKPMRAKTVTFSGRVLLPNPADAGRFRLQVNYKATWECKFYGLNDCLLAPFAVTSTDLDADGSFKVELPDFANDKTISAFGENGEFSFQLIHKNSGRPQAKLELKDDPKSFGGIRAASSYPNEKVFTLETER